MQSLHPRHVVATTLSLVLAALSACGSSGGSQPGKSDGGSEASIGAGGTIGTGGTSGSAGTANPSDGGGTGGTAGSGGSSADAGSTVTVSPLGAVPWLASKDGSGPWQPLSGTTFSVTDSAGRYGVAWVCVPGSGKSPTVNIVQATVGESDAVTASCQQPSQLGGTTYTVSGSVLGVPFGGVGFISIREGDATIDPVVPTYSIGVFSQAKNDLIAYARDDSNSGVGIVLQRDVRFSGDTTGFNVNLSQAPSFTVDTLKVANVPSAEQASAGVRLSSPGTSTLLAKPAQTATLSFPEIPANLIRSGDSYVLVGSASASSGSNSTEQDVTLVATSPSATTTLNLPPPLSSSAGVGVVQGKAIASWGTVAFASSAGLTVFEANVSFASGTAAAWNVLVTKGWLGSATSYSFPDPSSTAGWDASWNFPAGQQGTASVSAYHVNLTLPQFQALQINSDYSVLADGTKIERTYNLASGTF